MRKEWRFAGAVAALVLSAAALGLGLLIALPLGVLAARSPRLRWPSGDGWSGGNVASALMGTSGSWSSS